VLELIRKDFVRRWRSPMSTLAMLVFPFLMAGMIGAVSGGGSGPSFPRIDVLIEDRDDGFLTRLLMGPLQSGNFDEYLRVIEADDDGMARMERGEASALVIFPEGFTQSVLDGQPAQIQVVRNPAEGIKPEVVEQGVEVLATYLDQAAKIFGDELSEMAAMMDEDEYPGSARILAIAQSMGERLDTAARFIFPPVVSVEDVKQTDEDGSSPDFNVFGYVLVMVSVMSVLFVNSRAVLDLYDEEKTGMLRRQLATPMSVSQLIGSKIAFGVLMGIVVMILLLVIGALLGWYTWPVDLLGVVLVTVTFSAAACGVMCIVYALCRTDRQAAGFNWLVIMGMSALGGSMTPIDVFPEALQRVARFTLNYWAVGGYTDLLFQREPVGAVLQAAGILAVVGVITVAVGHRLLLLRYRRHLP
jgi:ABC-2 type transport system permease protein